MRPTRPALVLLAALTLPAAHAGVGVSFDVASLNELLPALSANEIAVPVAGGGKLGVKLDDLRVTGIDPGAGPDRAGRILTSMRVRVPSLGLDLPVEPRLSLHVRKSERTALLELRFEEVQIALPLAGSIDVASFLPPLSFPADNIWLVSGAEGQIEVRSQLSRIKMGRELVVFEFELDALTRD